MGDTIWGPVFVSCRLASIAILLASILLGAPVEAAPVKVDGRVPGTIFRECADCPEMVVVPAGNFIMGTPVPTGFFTVFADDGSDSERPAHEVRIAKPFAMGRYEVTQAEWQAVMGSNPSRFPEPRRPVEQVTWNDVQTFITRLNTKLRLTEASGRYHLPSEAEWEYAARAGTKDRYPWGIYVGHDNANCVSCASNGDPKQTVPVGQFPPNAFGLYDMHGNVYEWVLDCYKSGYDGAPSDGGPAPGRKTCRRIIRGGSWNTYSALLAAGSPVPVAADLQLPAVSVRKSVTPDAIICLECGKGFKMLKRHLGTDHGTTIADYRAKWSLPNDYPVVAPNYAAHRSQLAKDIGLGRKPKAAKSK